jgi:hypothetical protein
VCGVRGVNGRPATMSLCLGVTATLWASASRCLGVEGVQTFPDGGTSAFAGEFSFAVDRGSRDPVALCLAGVVPAFLPRFADGFSSNVESTSIASPLCTLFFFGVTNGFSFSASSRITNCACRFARVETFDFESADRVRDVLPEERRPERQSSLPGASALAELRVLFPRTVEAIAIMCRKVQWVVCSVEGTMGWGVEDEEGVGGRHAT